MEAIFAAAVEHIRLMETRIAQQEAAIELLKETGQDISKSLWRLQLLHSAFEEMRLQLARLVPTEEQVAAPMWALPLGNACCDRRTVKAPLNRTIKSSRRLNAPYHMHR